MAKSVKKPVAPLVVYNIIPTSTPIHDKSKTINALEVSQSLEKVLSNLITKFVSKDGMNVDYTKLKTSGEFTKLKQEVSQLPYINICELSTDQQKAFFINLFNILTIHAIVSQPKLPHSIRDLQQFWHTSAYQIGKQNFTLEDIEHGILRGNRPEPASIKPHFESQDPRLQFTITKLDPRIHFAIVWGCKSSPALNVYHGSNLDKSLDEAAKTFCEKEICMYTEVNEIWLPGFFKWYLKDFGKQDIDVIKSTLHYLSKEKQERARLLLITLDKIGNVAIKYAPFEWPLNSCNL